ncbi:MAG TPA: nitrogenase component 1 [Methylomusa anaerophila]|uniref:Nitrogenase molybdenum-iron protein beta chain n=1 Tax=Methylomusa anaerophila TaxID=1930071 RepID=A0A348AEY6_9FIRM|nr:nitrogenase component 1 [Methylomusa anaerophila]BBB89634.1 nitrogenase molybdenum-iron protein beta chain [Methylomusa anaerophila]HML89590.1 nitrogenase component 1 [Methylomusa anaerophila]
MGHPIESSRNHCVLAGALQTVQAVKGIVPIVHSTAGCGIQQYLGGSRVGGWNGAGYTGGVATPSSNIMEKQVIFGGSSRLREQIKNTVKIVKADLYVVLSGCATELVGDDIPAMTKEAQEQGLPVIHVSTPGFKGDVHTGYEVTVKRIIEQLPKLAQVPAEENFRFVNILGIIPGQDVFWQGHLWELQNILAEVGLTANTLFGFGQSIKTWQQVPQAELNLIFSPWGTGIADYLENKFGTPFLAFDSLPVGVDDTSVVLQVLREKLNLDDRKLAKVQQREEQRLAHYLERITDAYFEYDLQKEFALAGEAGLALGLARFLSKSFGLIPKVVIITDNPPQSCQERLSEEIKQLVRGSKTEVFFNEDRGRINDIIRRNDVELILGSVLEQEIAAELNVPVLQVSFPITDTAVLSKSYIGFNGAITLVEDLTGRILSWQSRLNHGLRDKVG